MRQFFVFFSILFLTGCCGSQVVLRKVEVVRPEILDTLDAEKSIIKHERMDSMIVWKGIGYKDGSNKDTAVVAEFIPALNKFVIRIPERVDTVLIRDTIRVKPTDIILRGDDNTERLIWIISFALTTIFIIIYKRYLNARSVKN